MCGFGLRASLTPHLKAQRGPPLSDYFGMFSQVPVAPPCLAQFQGEERELFRAGTFRVSLPQRFLFRVQKGIALELGEGEVHAPFLLAQPAPLPMELSSDLPTEVPVALP